MLTMPQTNCTFSPEKIREDFPILQQTVHGHPLVYLDNAATSQKPLAVINAISQYYLHYNSNVHRGLHFLSEQATQAYEDARLKAQHFINAKRPAEIIFTRGTTEAINLVAQSYGRTQLNKGDEILISEMEHHSNIVPWQLLCDQIGCQLKIIPMNDRGELCLDAFKQCFTDKTKFMSITHISNALGTINPIKEMITIAHQHQVLVLIDGAQATPHTPIDVQDLDCDFYAFSGHKMYGPTGIGVLYGKEKLLELMPPYQGGGEMIQMVSFEKTIYNELPYKFEAGTPDIAGAIGLGAAIDYLNQLGLDNIAAYEYELLQYAEFLASKETDMTLIGTAQHKANILSFLLGDIHAHDVGTILDRQGIAIRVGHHCAMPVMQHFNIPATARASLAFYNTKSDIDALFAGLHHVREIFR